MLKLLRRLVFGTLSLIVLIFVLFVAVPDRHIKSLVTKTINSLTQRQLHIGTFTLERSLHPRLTVTDVAFSNADWAARPSMFTADSISVSLQLPDLLKGQLVFQRVSSTGIQLHLEKGETGESNWQFSSEPRRIPFPKNLTVVQAGVDDTTITFLDQQTLNRQQFAFTEVFFKNDASDANVLASVNGEVNALPVSAVLSMQAGEYRSQAVSDLLRLPYELEISTGSIKVLASGQVSGVGNTQRVDSAVNMKLDSLVQLGEVMNQPLPDIGPVSLEAMLTIQPGTIASSGLQITDMNLTVADPRMQLEAQGQFTGTGSANNGSMNLSMNIPDVDSILAMFDIHRTLPGALSVDAILAGADSVFDIELKRVDFKSEFIDAGLAGTVEDILNTAQADVSVELNTPDLSLVTQLFGTNMPPEWGPITASASLQGKSGEYAINDIDATLDGNSKARVSGFIKSLMPFDQMHLDVDAHLSTLGEISTFTRKPLPDIGPVTGTGVVGWQDGALYLQEAKFDHNSQYGIAVVTGNVGDLIHFDKVRLRADAELPDFSALELFTGFALPEVDRVMASTNLISAEALDISARQLTVTATRDDVAIVGTGAVESFIKPYISVDLNLATEVDSLSRLNTISGRTLPELGPLQATAKLKGTGKNFALNEIKATLSDPDLSGEIASQIDDLGFLDELAFDVKLRTDDVSLIANRLGVDSSISAPANVDTTVRISGKNLVFDDTNIDVEGNRLKGNLSMFNALDNQQKTNVTGDLTLVKLDTRTLFEQTEDAAQELSDSAAVSKAEQEAASKARILSDEPLPINIMLSEDIDVNVEIEDMTSTLLDVVNANLVIKARDGVFSVSPFSGSVNKGQFELGVDIDTNNDPVRVDVNLSLNDVDLSRAMVFKGTDLIESTGGAWINLSFTGEGVSVADILGSATGEGGIYVEDLLFQENALAIFSSDLIDQLVDVLNPFADRQIMGTQLLCSAIMFQLQDGMLITPFGFATDAGDFSVVGDAQVSLKEETMEMMFNPKPKTGLGISLNRLAGLVKLEGAIASPTLSLSESGLLQFGASIAAAVASGGVTLLAEGLYNKLDSQSDVCAEALGN